MAMTFRDAVEGVREVIIEEFVGIEQEREYLNAPERLREAEEVEPCIERFVEYEFVPPEKGGAVGRGPGVYGDALAKALRKALPIDQLDEAARNDLRESVLVSLASGYVAFAWWQSSNGEPPPPQPGVDPRQLWERWMLRLASDALAKAIPWKGRESLFKIPEDTFVTSMKRQGVTKLRHVGKIGQLGNVYGKAGATLRLFQSTTEFDVEPHRSQQRAIADWPYERPGQAFAGH
jgi:hypothetical protein